ncbi:MAG: hypothetical protein WBW06_03265, partial [Xanthobacteraceae bacterium]
MSLSVTGSSNNPFANLQYLLQQDSSQSGATDQSNPLSALLAELSPTSTNSAASNSTTATSTAVSGGGSVQFDPQTCRPCSPRKCRRTARLRRRHGRNLAAQA